MLLTTLFGILKRLMKMRNCIFCRLYLEFSFAECSYRLARFCSNFLAPCLDLAVA